MKLSLKVNDVLVILYVAVIVICNVVLKNYINLQEQYSIINIIFLSLLLIVNIQKILNNSKRQFIIFIIAILFLLVEKQFNDTGIGSITTIINLYIIILLSQNIKLETKIKKIIFGIIIIFNIIFIFTDNSIYNLNTVAYLLVCMSIIGINFLNNKKIQKIIFLSIICIIIYFTESRTSLIAEIFILLMNIFNIEFIKNKKIYKKIILLLLLLSIVFIYIYIYMWNNQITITLGNFSEKNFYSGRQFIWNEVLTALKENVLFGLGSNYELESFSSFNTHNSLLGILSIHGIITFTIFLCLFYKCIVKMNDIDKMNNIKSNMIIGIIAILVVSWFENSLIQPIFQMYLFMILLIGNNENKDLSNKI